MRQTDWIRPETDADDVKRLYAGVFFLGIDRAEDGVLRGRLGHLFFRRVYPFDGLDDAIVKMDVLMDGLNCPPAGGRNAASWNSDGSGRSAAEAGAAGISAPAAEQSAGAPGQAVGEVAGAPDPAASFLEKLEAQALDLDEDGIARCDGGKLNFLVTVSDRENGSWQGNLVRVRRKHPNLRTRFTSTLQLLRLVREAAED